MHKPQYVKLRMQYHGHHCAFNVTTRCVLEVAALRLSFLGNMQEYQIIGTTIKVNIFKMKEVWIVRLYPTSVQNKPQTS